MRLIHYLPIVCARRSIYIANPYFIPDQAAIDTLIEARQRGVDVRIMVAGRHNDTWLARQNSRRLYGPLLEAGIQILEYNTTFMHQKTMVVDGIWVSIGTTNFDNRSFVHNEETSVCIKNAELAAYMEQTFRRDTQSCERVDARSLAEARPRHEVAGGRRLTARGAGLTRLPPSFVPWPWCLVRAWSLVLGPPE